MNLLAGVSFDYKLFDKCLQVIEGEASELPMEWRILELELCPLRELGGSSQCGQVRL